MEYYSKRWYGYACCESAAIAASTAAIFQGHRSLSSFRGLRPSPVRLPRISHSIVSCALMRGTSGGIPGRHSISSAPPQR